MHAKARDGDIAFRCKVMLANQKAEKGRKGTLPKIAHYNSGAA